MDIFKAVKPWKAHLKRLRSEAVSIGLVPTMGGLHPGHLSLIQRSKKENDYTVCSIYVNPSQFNNPTDFRNYPRTLERDMELLSVASCDAVFCPDNAEMYDDRRSLAFDFGALDKVLEGKFRPGHFSGVALVVSKLFHIIEADSAYFGLKDFQQFRIISQMANELKFNTRVVGMPIVREEDGLAMSSRNTLLTPSERQRATTLYACLTRTKNGILKGLDFSSLKEEAIALCVKNEIRLEYFSLADKRDLTLHENRIAAEHAILLMAGFVGQVRLIDNVFLTDN